MDENELVSQLALLVGDLDDAEDDVLRPPALKLELHPPLNLQDPIKASATSVLNKLTSDSTRVFSAPGGLLSPSSCS